VRLVPAWLVALVLLPLQVWFAIELWKAYGFWQLLAIGIVLAFLGSRASAPHWLRALFAPGWAVRWQQRRHVYQGILFLVAAIAFLLVAYPQPWVPAGLTAWLARGHPFLAASALVSLVKAALR
jgi:hypothetical protein